MEGEKYIFKTIVVNIGTMAVSEVDIDIPAASMVKSGDDIKEGVAARGLLLIPHNEEKDRILQFLSQHEYQAASEIYNKACQKITIGLLHLLTMISCLKCDLILKTKNSWRFISHIRLGGQ